MMEQVASGAGANAKLSGVPAYKEQHFETPLLAGNEIERIFDRDKRRVLILGAGFDPLVAERLIYFEDKMFEKLCDDPKRPKRRRNGNTVR